MDHTEENLKAFIVYKGSTNCSVCEKIDPKNRIKLNPASLARFMKILTPDEFMQELSKHRVFCEKCESPPRIIKVRRSNKEIIAEHKLSNGCIVCGLINEENWIMSPSGQSLTPIREIVNKYTNNRLLRELDKRIVICKECAYDRMGRENRVVTKRSVEEIRKRLRDDFANSDPFAGYSDLGLPKIEEKRQSHLPFDPYK